jgi:hypothetical protein
MIMATNYKEYIESEAVKQAKAALEAQQAQKPGAYTSQWQQQLNDTLDKIQNREKFQYDLNGDALYQQYKDRYIQQGQQAMMDTMGQAVALTGGYGNSYAQTVGQQTYQGYLQGLNDKVPELYQLALDRYNQETNDLYTKFGLYDTMEQKDYGRYQDSMNEFNAQLEYLTGRYDAERDYDYGKYADDRNFSYQVERDTVADQQWQKEFDEAVRQYNESVAAAASKGSGGGGGGGGYVPPQTPQPPQTQETPEGPQRTVEDDIADLKKAGETNRNIRNAILQATREGLIDVEEARRLNSIYAGVNYNN